MPPPITDSVWEAARADNPGIEIDRAAFARFLADRLGSGLDEAGRLRAGDAYLACACAVGDRRAHAAFEEKFGKDVRALARRFVGPGLDEDDLVQAFRVKVLVGSDERRPKLAEYDGCGFLQNWVRVTALRTFIDVQRSVRADERRKAGESLAEAAQASGDLELDFLKREYRSSFRAAFARAVRGLDAKDRALLRHHTIHRLGIDQLAVIYNVHRATAARRLDAARAQLLERVRDEVKSSLRIGDEELDSMIGLVQSQLDVSFARLLQSEEGGR